MEEWSMAYDEADDLFGSGGGGAPSFKFEKLGDVASGKIVATKVQNQTDFDDPSIVLKKPDGTPKKQLVVTLQTSHRGWAKVARIPTDAKGNPRPAEEDDGRRNVYVRGWMVGAVGDAVRAAGQQGAPKIGGQLAVRWSDERPDPAKPQRKPMKLWEARYSPPAAGDDIFEEERQPAKVAAGSEGGWSAPPAPSKKAPAADPWGSSDENPPF